MNLTEKIEQKINEITEQRLEKDIHEMFNQARIAIGLNAPELKDSFNAVVEAMKQVQRKLIRAEVEEEFLKRLADPEKHVTQKDMLERLKEFEEAARKNYPVQPHHPWPSPPWPTQPHFPESPYKQPFGPVWCGPDVTTTFTQP